MKNELLKISLRQNAIFIPTELAANKTKEITATTSILVENALKLGFTFSEPLLQALNGVSPKYKTTILETLHEVLGTNKNWTPLVKGWDKATGESVLDHIITFFANKFNSKKGTTLPCGHLIPENTFPLERYNGCPFCGTPFEFGKIETYGQGTKLKVLDLWIDIDVANFYKSLLQSKTALDATQVESLKTLLQTNEFPDVAIAIKETLMLVINHFEHNGQAEKAQKLFKSPVDILRYLWFQKTGFLQIVEPKTIMKRTAKNNLHISSALNTSAKSGIENALILKLHYKRAQCLTVATWLNNLDLDVEKSCEMMHPKRGMWVRLIRALRLAEYSKRPGFEKLAQLLDAFYNQNYEVWQSKVNHFRLRSDAENTLKLLQQRPALFARSLFANMLWFGQDQTIEAFLEIIEKVPARLVFTLNMYAQNYFDKTINRSVKPLGGTNKQVPANQLLKLYDEKQLDTMKSKIEELCIVAMKKRFSAIENHNKTIFIHEQLFNMPVSIGDRSEAVQDLPVALMGTKFPVEGNEIRLFMQWGEGLPAQHLDMDLSCMVAYENKIEICSYSNLAPTGCKHSGDIREIPNKIGTAEYININLDKLASAAAKFVTFTCNAYSNGAITPNLIVGWMDSKFPMKVSERTGVAFDPSCVQHQVRVTQNAAKGMVFGVLDVAHREIIWLEMTFGGQVTQNLDLKGVQALLSKLKNKLSIGALLKIKAEAQNQTIMDNAQNADEIFDMQWAINTAAVTQLLVD
jgi:hypothetical protein